MIGREQNRPCERHAVFVKSLYAPEIEAQSQPQQPTHPGINNCPLETHGFSARMAFASSSATTQTASAAEGRPSLPAARPIAFSLDEPSNCSMRELKSSTR